MRTRLYTLRIQAIYLVVGILITLVAKFLVTQHSVLEVRDITIKSRPDIELSIYRQKPIPIDIAHL